LRSGRTLRATFTFVHAGRSLISIWLLTVAGKKKPRRRVVKVRVNPPPLEDQKELAADMGMTLWEYTNYRAGLARTLKGIRGKPRLPEYQLYKKFQESPDLDLRKIIKPKKG
jgi:hypothetical protein